MKLKYGKKLGWAHIMLCLYKKEIKKSWQAPSLNRIQNSFFNLYYIVFLACSSIDIHLSSSVKCVNIHSVDENF